MNKQLCFVLLLVAILVSCSSGSRPVEAALTEKGVSIELARFRKEQLHEVRYTLSFSIPEARTEPIRGELLLSLKLNEQQPLIVDFRGAPEQISSVALNGVGVPYEFTNEHLIVSPQATVKGENRLAISFEANDQSLNRREEFLYTLLVPDRARTLFPCLDQPDMKARFTLHLELPAHWEAVANGAETHTELLPEERKRISFAESEPLPTYLFSFVCGRLTKERYEQEGRSIHIYHRETDPKKIAQLPCMANEVFDALRWLEHYTAIPYPFAKYDVIILPGFQYGGMEHTGATLYTDRRMFLNEQPTLNEQLSRSALIAHETAHMWFGDYVTMEWFNDVWTKEVFANYYASRIVEPLFPEVNHRLNFLNNYLPASYAEDRTAGSNPIRQELNNMCNAGLVYGNIIYNKSPVMMDMLVRKIGEESFQKGIRQYLKTYAYGNATWDGLIAILDNYTPEDLATWSHLWVNERGMADISATVRGDSLIVTQTDPLGRGLNWPQELTYRVISGDKVAQVSISLSDKAPSAQANLGFVPTDTCVVIPNTDGRGYGFFRLGEEEATPLFALLESESDEVVRGSLLITLYENLLRRTLSAKTYQQAMLKYLPKESNSLLFSMALGYVGSCHGRFHPDGMALEQALWQVVEHNSVPQHRQQAFRLYASTAQSPQAAQRLYEVWNSRQSPAGCTLSENDYINLSYNLSLLLPKQAEALATQQLSRITNPDKRREYQFISPAVSPRKEVRDSLFQSLLVAENRRIEPWASTALSYLNHPLLQQEAVAYIRPALEVLEEVQRTGDIFFPSAWCRALLAGHTSEEAAREVEHFFEAHPHFPPMLSNKVKQQSGHLEGLSGSPSSSCRDDTN